MATNGVSGVLASIAKEVMHLEGDVKKLGQAFKKLHPAVLSIASAFAAVKAAGFTKHLVDANGELERQITLSKLAGATAKDAADGRARAFEVAANVRGSGVTHNYKLYREASAAVGSYGGGNVVMPDLARARNVIEAMTGHVSEQDLNMLVKTIELRGKAIDQATHSINPDLFRKELDAMVKGLVAAQGLLGPKDFYNAMKQASPIMKDADPYKMWGGYLAGMEDMGGARFGTSLTAIGRQMLGGIMTGRSADELHRFGILTNDPEGSHYDKKKKHWQVDDAEKGIRGFETLMREGFQAFNEKVLKPAFEKQYMDKNGHIDQSAVSAEMYKFGSTETGRRLMALQIAGAVQQQLVQKRYNEAAGLDGQNVLEKDYQFNMKALGEALHNLKTALGDAAMVAPMLGHIADGINVLAKAAGDHPGLATGTTIAGGLATLGFAGYAGVKGYQALTTGFGLTTAAAALNESAAALSAAAGKMAGGSAVSGAANAAEGGAAAAGGASLAGVAAAVVPLAVAGAAAYLAGGKYQPEEVVRARAEMAEITRKLQVYDSLIASGNGNEGTAGKRAAAQARFDELKRSLEQAGNEAGKSAADNLKTGFNPPQFSTTGTQAGDNTKHGFLGADFRAAGGEAGNALVQGFKAAVGAISGMVGKINYAPPAGGGTAVQVHTALHMDGRKIAQMTSRHMARAAIHPRSIGGPDNHGVFMAPGAVAVG